MKLNLLHVCTLLSVVLIRGHATVSPQVYWNSVLPKTPMPKAIKDVLYTKAWDDGKEKVATDTSTAMSIKLKDQPEQYHPYVASKDVVPNQFFYNRARSSDEAKDRVPNQFFYNRARSSDEAKDRVPNQFFYNQARSSDEAKDRVPNLYPFLFYNWGRSSDEAKDNEPKEDVMHNPFANLYPFLFYNWRSSDEAKDNEPKEDVMHNPSAQLLFLENDLYQGKQVKLQFNIINQKTTFLPKDIVDSMPFSSKDLPEIYKMFSVKPGTMEAETIKLTLRACDQSKGFEVEEKLCATSLESMVDFVTTNLGKNVKALSTENAKDSMVSQNYTIELVKKLVADKVIICHRHIYPYAVFHCHAINGTQAYVVSLEGVDGTKVKSMAVCHTDTSKFDPNHMAFKVLKVAPGGVPVCHFLLEDTILWVPYK